MSDKGKGDGSHISGAIGIIGSATALSRVLGYIRDASIAHVFGAAMLTDAFFVAFRISNLLRRLVGEGALTSSFVPIFTEELTLRSREAARTLSSSVFTLFGIILVVLSVVGILISGPIVELMSPGFVADPGKFALTVRLTRLMFPYMISIGLTAIGMGVLNSVRHFAAPALSPVLFNISIIASIFLVAPFLTHPVYALPVGVLAGGLFQFLLLVPFLSKFGFMPTPTFRFRTPGVGRIFRLMGPAAFGVGVYQLNIFVVLWFASRLPEGSVSYLYYSGRLMELPLGVFSVAVSTAVLPSLSEQVTRLDHEGFRRSLSYAIRIVVYMTVPAMAGLLVLCYPIIEVLFKHGEFGTAAVDGTAYALYFYTVGIVPVAISRVLVSVYYSLKDTATPLYIALVTFVVNVVLCYLLVGPMGHGGLALATSISAGVNFVCLFVALRIRMRSMGFSGGGNVPMGGPILSSGVRAVLAASIMGGAIYLLSLVVSPGGLAGVGLAVYLAVAMALGFVVYFSFSTLLRIPEVTFLKGFLNRLIPGARAR